MVTSLCMCVLVNLFVSQTKRAQICCGYMNEPSSQNHPDSFPHSKSNHELELLSLHHSLYHWCNLSLADEETFNWVLTIWRQMKVSILKYCKSGPFCCCRLFFRLPLTSLLSQPPVSFCPWRQSLSKLLWITFVFYSLLSIWGHIFSEWQSGWVELSSGESCSTLMLWINTRAAAGQRILE